MKRIAWVASILLGVVPLLSLSLFFYQEFRAISKDTLLQAITREAEIGAGNLNDFILERQGNLAEWAQSSPVRVAFEFNRPEGLNGTLNFLKKQYPAYEWIKVFDGQGRQFSSSESVPATDSEPTSPSVDRPNSETALIDQIVSTAGDLTQPRAVVLNSDLYVIAKIEEPLVNGNIVAKITAKRFETFIQQVKQHLERHGLSNVKITFFKSDTSPADEIQKCAGAGLAGLRQSLCIAVPAATISARIRTLQIGALSMAFVLTALTFLLISGVLKTITDSFFKLLNSLSQVLEGKYERLSLSSRIPELREAETKYNLLIEKMQEANQLTRQQERAAALYQVSLQLAHDIRSPLSVLNLIEHQMEEFPKEKRTLVREATQRITDIATDLLRRHNRSKDLSSDGSDEVTTKQIQLLAPLIESLVSEKRLQYHGHPRLQIDCDLEDSFGIFVTVNHVELKRVLSNLINNSVEAMTEQGGRIRISIRALDKTAKIVVFDNGQGISEEILSRLGEKDFSFGKTLNSQSGSGLGLYHARKTMLEHQGRIEIESRPGQGTRVELDLPRSNPPLWFADKFSLGDIQTIVVCDDDRSIHALWREKLKGFKGPLLHFFTLAEFEKCSSLNEESKNTSFFLIDFDIAGLEKTGLDLIINHNLAQRSFLVTSRFDDPTLQSKCAENSIRILPKLFLRMIPLIIEA
jgi:signal transduction histidine kinase